MSVDSLRLALSVALCFGSVALAGVPVVHADDDRLELPEPMVVDLAQGLGAEQGEVEINTLVLVPTSAAAVFWAPEVEVTVVDNFAVEVEADFRNADAEALEFAFLGTVGMNADRSIGHGIQGHVGYEFEEEAFLSTVLYVIGARLAPPVSLVALVGPALLSHIRGKSYAGFSLNVTLFWEPHPRVAIGTEQNFEWFPNAYLIRWMPQVAWQVHEHFEIQAGFGLRHLDGENSPEAGTRLIAEF